MQGLIGRKRGMTEVFDGQGRRLAVTVLEAGPCVVVQRKTRERDGYDAVQLGLEERKESRTPRPQIGHFKRAGVTPRMVLREMALDDGDSLKEGDTVGADVFQGVAYVDVVGMTKGKGFQGVVRRHSMAGGPMTHGGHSKRRIGAIGQRAVPGRVHLGHRMPGHMGHVRATAQNLQVVEVRGPENLLLVRGAVPGPRGGLVLVKRALKRSGKAA